MPSGSFPISCGNGPWAFYVVWAVVGAQGIFIDLKLVVLTDTMWVFTVLRTLKFVSWNFSWTKKLPRFEGWSLWNARAQACVSVCNTGKQAESSIIPGSWLMFIKRQCQRICPLQVWVVGSGWLTRATQSSLRFSFYCVAMLTSCSSGSSSDDGTRCSEARGTLVCSRCLLMFMKGVKSHCCKVFVKSSPASPGTWSTTPLTI